MPTKEEKKRIVIDHYLANKDNKNYDPDARTPKFSINKMGALSRERLGFYICKDAILSILSNAGVREKDYSKRRPKVSSNINHNYFWNSFLMWKLR